MDRSQLIHELIEERDRRLRAGETMPERDLITAHPDLMPELGEQLDKLQAGDSTLDRLERTKSYGFGAPKHIRLPRTFGNYRIIARIAEGGMGIVYRAQQLALGRTVALKMIRSGALADKTDQLRFYAEAEAAAHLDHPNIVPIYEIGKCEGQHFFSMAYIDGPSLAQVIREQPLSSQKAAQYLEPIARAIQFAHERGILHRDLKPSNVLVDQASDEPRITDFGLAKRIGKDSELTATGQVVGTPCYMPREQALGLHKKVNEQSDVYSLGALLYALLSSRPPFQADTSVATLMQVVDNDPVPPRQLNPAIDADLETICLKCLEKAPAQRYQSAGALADDLGRYLRGEPIEARPVRSWERAWKWIRRRPAVASLIAVSIVAVLSIGAGGLFYAQSAHQRARLAERDLLEHENFVRLSGEVQQLVASGQTARVEGDLEEARIQLAEALAKIGRETRLAKEKTQAENLMAEVEACLDEQESREAIQEQLVQARRRRDDALFYGSQSTGLDLKASLQASRDSARQALQWVGLSDQAKHPSLLESPYLSDQEKADLKISAYELLLVWAEAVAQPIPGEENRHDQAAKALKTLGRAQVLLGTQTLAYHLQRAKYLAQQDNEVEAAAERRRAEEVDPASATAVDHFLAGKLLMTAEPPRPSEAIKHFDNALRLRPDHFWAEYFLALCYLRSQRPDLAKAHLTACVGYHPDFVWTYILRGFVHGELEEYDAAEADFRHAEQLPLDDNARYILLVNRGVMQFRKGDVARATGYLEEAIRLRPDEFQGYANLAHVFQKQKQYDRAERYFAEAIRLQPEMADLYRTRAAMWMEQDRLVEALQDFDEVIRCEANRGGATAEDLTQKGRIFQYQSRHEDALDAYDTALTLDPNNPLANLLRGELLLEQEQYGPALVSLDAYFRKGRPTADAYFLRGRAKHSLHDYMGAIGDFSRALEFEPNSAIYAWRGWIYMISGAPRIALSDFEKTIQLDPQNGDAYNGRGLALVKLGKTEPAVGDAENALRLGPKTPWMLHNGARIYAQAAGLLVADPAHRTDSPTARQAKQYEDKALDLLRGAMEMQPAEEQGRFWETRIEEDELLDPLRHNPAFAQLGSRFARAGE